MVNKPYHIANGTRKYFLLLPFLLLSSGVFSQQSMADSLSKLLATDKIDTNRVIHLWRLADAVKTYNPDTARDISYQALKLAKNINYTEGQSRSLGILANSFMSIGNYPKALALNFEKLQLEEKRNNPRNLGSVLMNIGIVYVYQEEYRKALEYYARADSVIFGNNVEKLKYSITLNIGDVYNRLDISDSAYVYFNKSLSVAKQTIPDKEITLLNIENKIGLSLTGLGHSYKKIGSYQQSLHNYQEGILHLQAANNDETLCEATLGLAGLYQLLSKNDSAGYFARLSLATARKGKFLSHQFEASKFLAEHFKKIKNIDSAFVYLNQVEQLNDSVNSKSRIRESQILSSNEQFRQLELEESRKLAKKERYQQLQMLLIGSFIPGLFLITLFLNRKKIHIKIVRLLGVLSLLFLFEYLTLLLHPTVANLTHHTPVYEILIFVVIAAVLIPAHHRFEHWLIHKLLHHRIHHTSPDKKQGPTPADKINSPA